MNKQEAIELVKNTSYSVPINDSVKYLREETVIKIIDELDEPEKPVVPQYVADMIIEKKKQYGIVDTIKNLWAINDPFDLVVEKQLNWIVENQEDFAKAWLYGYEVEKEKLYTVEIPNPNGGEYSRTYLGKYASGKVGLYNWTGFTHIAYADDWKKEEKSQLTEAEIRKDFAWAWEFAEEV